jgi:hypothetical protein
MLGILLLGHPELEGKLNIAHHRPSKWLVNKATKEQIAFLASELEAEIPATTSASTGDVQISTSPSMVIMTTVDKAMPKARNRALGIEPVDSVHGGEWNGVYVVKELVYSYAMWINPAFHIKVVRTFDAVVNGAHVLPHQQNEIYWFARRPRWEFIRRLALEGWPYRAIAKMFDPRLGQGSIANSVQAMVVRGLINPQALATAQHGVSRKAAERRVLGWGMFSPQLSLAF